MAQMRTALRHTVVKNLGYKHTTSTAVQTAIPIDLRDATATSGKFTFAKLVFVGTKTGTNAIASATMTPLTGSTVSCATALTNYPVKAAGTDPGHGYIAAAGTAATGNFVIEYDIDLEDSGVLEWLGCTVSITCTTDVVDGIIFVILGGSRELPNTNVAMATTL